MREVEAAYHSSRRHAQGVSTVRLRWAERRARRHADQLSQPDLARLKAIRDELRWRGVDVPELWSRA